LRAQKEGYCVLAVDLRGHGQSICADKPYRTFGPEDWQQAEDDIHSFKQSLLDTGANPNNIFLAGEGVGANLGLRYALRDPQIQAAVLFSPGDAYLGVSISSLGLEARRLPLLIIAGEGDSYAARSSERLHRDSPGYTELHLQAGTAFGVDLLTGAPDSTALIFRWLHDIIKQ
jgi:pimeloyl-ACP methyl ester carboxylesterase